MVTQINTDQFKISFSKYIQKLKDFLLIATITISLNIFSGNDIAKADTFGCFIGAGTTPASTCNGLPSLLSSSVVQETNEDKCLRSVDGDWHTTVTDNKSDVTVLSIHGGEIEQGTSKISHKLENLYKWDRYNFEGHVKRDKCRNLNPTCDDDDDLCFFHITSTHFNDPAAVGATGLIKTNPKAVSIHGCGEGCTNSSKETVKESKTICIGGGKLDNLNNITATVARRNLVKNYIDQYRGLIDDSQQRPRPRTYAYKRPNGQENDASLPQNSFDEDAYCDDKILGSHPLNIVNEASIKAGIQLEISRKIRDALTDALFDPIDNDLLRTIVYGGVAKGINELPLPILATNGTETYTTSAGKFKRYKLKVENKIEYSAALFAPAPNLPPCGLNTNSSRTWVNIYNATNDQRIYGFCALGSPNNLDNIWFAVKDGSIPPATVYITLEDRLNNRIYRSNKVKITA